MKYLIYILVIIFLLSANLGIFPYLKIFGVVPNLLFLWTIAWSLEVEGYDFLFNALFSGLVLDCFSGALFGGFALTFLFFGSLINFLRNRIVLPQLSWKHFSGVILVVSIISQLFYWFISKLALHFGAIDFLPEQAVSIAGLFISAFYNLVLFFPLLLLQKWIKNFLARLNRARQTI